jgi:putative phosphonate metabolism protein
MWDYKRYAIYYAPEPGPLAAFGASWLGWDAAAGCAVTHPQVPTLPQPVADLTATPRKYGFHGTVKPPFRLAEGQTAQALHAAAATLCTRLAPVTLDGLRLSRLGSFLALTPMGDTSALAQLAGTVVQELDGFRAPLTEAEIAKRNPGKLTEAQRALLEQWGYPYVFEEFRFHLTLTGRLDDEADAVETALAPMVAPILPTPFEVNSLCLFGEADDGLFHLLHRYALSG